MPFRTLETPSTNALSPAVASVPVAPVVALALAPVAVTVGAWLVTSPVGTALLNGAVFATGKKLADEALKVD